MLTPLKPEKNEYPYFKNVYLGCVKATDINQFITALGWNGSLRLENFNLFILYVEACRAGKVAFHRSLQS